MKDPEKSLLLRLIWKKKYTKKKLIKRVSKLLGTAPFSPLTLSFYGHSEKKTNRVFTITEQSKLKAKIWHDGI